MSDEIIIWLDDKYCLSRSYNNYPNGHQKFCITTWKLSSQTDSIIMRGAITKNIDGISLTSDLDVNFYLYDDKSFELIKYFAEPTSCWLFVTTTFRWDNHKFKISDACDITEFTFPLDGVKALVEDMTNMLKELGWAA